jgi:hypothetical protein
MRSIVKCLIVLATLHAVPQSAASQQATEAWIWADARNPPLAPIPIQEAEQPMTLQREGPLRPWNNFSPVQPSLWSIQDSEGGSGWRKGAIVGGLVGAGVGLATFLFIDSLPCDSCSGASDGAASGTGPEFVLGFGLVGAAIGALLGH